MKKRKSLVYFMICIMLCVVLAGCGGKTEKTDLADKLKKAEESVAENNESPKKEKSVKEKGEKEEEKDEKAERNPASVPIYCISEPGDAECETIHIIDGDGSYAWLSDELKKINDDIVMSAYDTGTEDTVHNICVRRADDKVFSFVHEYREPDGESDYVQMRGYSFLLDSGKRLELSDVVDDKDAFYRMLSDELYKNVTKVMMIMAGEFNIGVEDFDASAAMNECLNNDRYGWVLDPQGVTFWFESVNALIGHASATVLFSADKTGRVFNEEFAKNAPDEWIMRIPESYSSETYFDNDDDGTMDSIYWYPDGGYLDGEFQKSGFGVKYNDRYFDSSEICPADEMPWSHYRVYLMHKDNQTVLVKHHYEEVESIWDSFSLENDLVKSVDRVYAYPRYENYAPQESGWLVPIDMSAIHVYSDHGGDEMTEYPDEILTVSGSGKMKVGDLSDKDSTSSGKASAGDSSDNRKEAYQKILYKYKEAQDMQYQMDDVESMGLKTELVQHGWPSGTSTNDVKYLYYDVDSDGNDELIITYYGEIIDIYGYDGKQARLAFSTPNRGIAEIHPDGMLELLYSLSVSSGRASWYQYDTALGNYLEVFECRSEGGKDSYYTFGAYNMNEEERRQVEESYRDIGTYPVWLYEWSGELTEKEYKKIVPTTDPIKLPKGDLLSDVVLPDDYKYAKLPDNAQSTKSADTIKITKDMQKQLNVFLSNFVEQGMGYFDYGRPDAGELADFAYRWTYINKWTDLSITTDGYYTLSLDKVKNLVNKYMDITLTDDDLNSYTWPNVYQGFISKGRYCVPAADGDSYTRFAVVTSLSEEGANIYRAEFDIYDLDWDFFLSNEEVDSVPKEYYSYSAAEAASEPNLTREGSGYAVIKKDGDSYKLRFYDLYR